jgi:hypothetical protein
MDGFLKFLVWPKDAHRKLFALAFASGVAGLSGFGAFAIGSAIGGSTAAGIALAGLASLSLFSPMLSMLSMPDSGTEAIGEKTSSLKRVFSGLF